MKPPSKLEKKKNFFILIYRICKELTANNVPNGEKLNCALLRSGTRLRFTLLSLLFNIILEVPAIAIIHEKEINGIKIAKEKRKTITNHR